MVNTREEHGGKSKTLLYIQLAIVVVATSQLIQGYYHVSKYLHFPDDESINIGGSVMNDVKARLHRFRGDAIDKKVANITATTQTHTTVETSSTSSVTSIVNNVKEVVPPVAEHTSKVGNVKEVVPPTVVEPKNLIQIILEKSGVPMTPDLIDKIPPFSQVIEMYGDKPTIIGLDRCEEFRQNVDPADRFLAVAGMFNSGTNLLHTYLSQNCRINDNMLEGGIRWQVPWGKHNPLSYRGQRYADDDIRFKKLDNILPLVIIKDPYTWMQSLCRNSYAAEWKFTMAHCPNLVPNNVDKYYGFVKNRTDEEMLMQEGIPMIIEYKLHTEKYKNIAAAWNVWYGEYFDVTTPRLIVRFEDLILHTTTVVTDVCNCFGGSLLFDDGVVYVKDSPKKGQDGHSSVTPGLLGALLYYTNSSNRLKSFTKDDVLFANKVLNKTMMEMLSYKVASAENLDNPWRTVPFKKPFT